MNHATLAPFLALSLAATTLAQSPTPSPTAVPPERITGPVRHAGIYHVATGTWTRHAGPVAGFGPDTIYNNTAQTGYFTSAGGAGGFGPGGRNIDEGALPGTTNPGPFARNPNRDDYLVNGFEIAYCDNGLSASGGWEIEFYSSYVPCVVPTGGPDATIPLTGLPAGGCWTITVDLTGGSEFCLEADGGSLNPGWDNVVALDSFGWGYRYIGSDGAAPAGFILTGDPTYTAPNYTVGGLPRDGTGTYYGATSLCATPTATSGTGYLTQDQWLLIDPVAPAQCFFFGGYINRNGCGGPQGNPFGSFHMQVFAESTTCSGLVGSTYCLSNPNSTGVVSDLQLAGTPDVAADDLTLRAIALPLNSFGFFITSPQQGFTANPVGSQGNLCLTGSSGRFVGPGQIQTSGQVGEISLSTASGLWSLTSIPGPNGPYSATAGAQTNFQLWYRDSVGGAATSNFSNGATVTW